jgi:lysine biosynthesis protein LysW
MVGVCPECDAQVSLGANPGLGQRAECPNCRARLTVINLNPLDLDWAFEEPLIRSVQEAEEDWAL